VLQYKSPRKIREALNDAMPTELFDLYEITMNQITQSVDNLALKTLSWILYAKRPLIIDELQHAIVVEDGDRHLNEEDLIPAKTLVEVCRSFIVYDQVSRVVEFSHETVREFLQAHHTHQLLQDVDLAKTCLNYLTFDVFEDGPCLDKQSFDRRMQSHQFMDYAVKFWGSYVRGKGEEDLQIQSALSKLFKSSHKCNTLRQHRLWIDAPWHLKTSVTWTPLHIIAIEGLSTIYDQFISKEDLDLGSLESKNDRDERPLHLAASQGWIKMVDLLVYRGADLESKDRVWGRTPLSWAAENGHLEVAKFLVKAGADVESKDESERTPLSRTAIWTSPSFWSRRPAPTSSRRIRRHGYHPGDGRR